MKDKFLQIDSYSSKLNHYFQIYEDILNCYIGKPVTLVEIGVKDGGSLELWREYLGVNARIVGIDLNPEAKKFEKNGFEIFIGDQGSENDLKKIFNQIGHIDIIIDDGGHQSHQQINTFIQGLYHIKERGVIIIEDTHSNFLKDLNTTRYSFLNFSKQITDLLFLRVYNYYQQRSQKTIKSRLNDLVKGKLYNVQFFTSITVFHINTKLCEDSYEISNNKPKLNSNSDFRYNGKSKIKIPWPSLTKNKKVSVSGGKNAYYYLTALKILIKNKF